MGFEDHQQEAFTQEAAEHQWAIQDNRVLLPFYVCSALLSSFIRTLITPVFFYFGYLFPAFAKRRQGELALSPEQLLRLNHEIQPETVIISGTETEPFYAFTLEMKPERVSIVPSYELCCSDWDRTCYEDIPDLYDRLAQGSCIYTFNYPGLGNNAQHEAVQTYEDMVDAAYQVACHIITTEKILPEQLVISGRRFGANVAHDVAIRLHAEKQFVMLRLDDPILDLAEHIAAQIPLINWFDFSKWFMTALCIRPMLSLLNWQVTDVRPAVTSGGLPMQDADSLPNCLERLHALLTCYKRITVDKLDPSKAVLADEKEFAREYRQLQVAIKQDCELLIMMEPKSPAVMYLNNIARLANFERIEDQNNYTEDRYFELLFSTWEKVQASLLGNHSGSSYTDMARSHQHDEPPDDETQVLLARIMVRFGVTAHHEAAAGPQQVTPASASLTELQNTVHGI